MCTSRWKFVKEKARASSVTALVKNYSSEKGIKLAYFQLKPVAPYTRAFLKGTKFEFGFRTESKRNEPTVYYLHKFLSQFYEHFFFFYNFYFVKNQIDQF